MDNMITAGKQWFYEEAGKRKGPLTEEAIAGLIQNSVIASGTAVWRQGLPDWLKVEDSELNVHLDNSVPPPLSGQNINNTIVWVLAFAPVIGYLLESFVAGAIHDGNNFGFEHAMANNEYWFITIGLNLGLAYLDENKLKKAGHNTEKFRGMTWLVPVYLYQRAKATKQNLAYFVTWIVCFVLTLL